MASLIRPVRIADLMKMDFPPEPVWIGPSILPKSCKMLLGGQAKVGKSLLMMELGRALALGKEPFDCPKSLINVPKPASVLLIEHELKLFGLQKRIKKAYNMSDEEMAAMNFDAISGEHRINFSSTEGCKLLTDVILEFRPEILMLDPISKMHNLDENSNTEVGRMFSYLDSLIEIGKPWGMSIIMSHHFGKPPTIPTERDAVDPYNFRGASKFKDDPDVLVTAAIVPNGGIINTPHKAWRLRTRWTLRHDESPSDMFLRVNEMNDLRVRFEKLADLPPLMPKDIPPTPDPEQCPISKSGVKTYD